MTDAIAVWMVGPRQIELRDSVVPPPKAGEVQVRTIVSGISQGSELLVYRGQVPQGMALDLPTLAGDFAFPITYGYACVGRVIATGAGVQSVAAGDLVFALHPHQSVFNAPIGVIAALGNTLDPIAGLFSANVETALNIAHDTPIYLGETVIIFGMGVVGLLAAQTLRRAGAGRVFAVDPLPTRQALARQVGVDAVFSPGPQLAAEVCAANDNRLADIALEASGSPAALQSAIDSVMDEGTVVVASWYGTKPVTLALGERFHRGRLTLRSSQVGRLNPALGQRWDYARRLATVAALLPQLYLRELVTHRFPIERAAEAYRLLDQQPGVCGQVVLEYPDAAGGRA